MRLTKTDRKLISKIAKSLPKMVSKTETVRIVLSGESILERDHSATIGETANSVLPNKKYLSGDIQKEINHKKKLEKAFLKNTSGSFNNVLISQIKSLDLKLKGLGYKVENQNLIKLYEV